MSTLFSNVADLSSGLMGPANRTPRGFLRSFRVAPVCLGGVRRYGRAHIQKLLRPPNQPNVSSSLRRSSRTCSGKVLIRSFVVSCDCSTVADISAPAEGESVSYGGSHLQPPVEGDNVSVGVTKSEFLDADRRRR